MKNIYFKQYKLEKIQKIKQNFKYIYIFRYNDLTKNEIILLKQKLKKIKYNSLILKQNLFNKIFLNIKGQGSLILIYGEENINLIKDLNFFKKIELVLLYIKPNLYSNLKIKKLNSNTNLPFLNILIVRPILNFLYYLRKI